MHVTIVTSVLNGAKTLQRCLDSVASQTYLCEHIIVDGGSTDGSQKLAHEFGLRVIDAPGSGISEAFNIGILNSTGDVIAILNADDWLERNATERSVFKLQSRPNAGFTFGSVLLHFKNYKLIVHPRSKVEDLAPFATKQLPFSHITSFVKRSIYEEYGMYDNHLKVAMDFDFYARISSKGIKGVYVDGVVANATAGGVSSNTITRLKDCYFVLSQYHGKITTSYYLTRYALNSLLFNLTPPGSALWRYVNSKGNRQLVNETVKVD